MKRAHKKTTIVPVTLLRIVSSPVALRLTPAWCSLESARCVTGGGWAVTVRTSVNGFEFVSCEGHIGWLSRGSFVEAAQC